MSLYARLAAFLIVLAVAAGLWWKADRMLVAEYRRGRQDQANESKVAADAQAQRMRELQRAAETRYVVQQGVRDRFIVQTVREIRHAAAPLASCPVPDGARVLLNDAALCARGDSAAACGDDQRMRNP